MCAAKNILEILLSAAQNSPRPSSLRRPRRRPSNQLQADLQEQQEGLLAAVAEEEEEAAAVPQQPQEA